MLRGNEGNIVQQFNAAASHAANITRAWYQQAMPVHFPSRGSGATPAQDDADVERPAKQARVQRAAPVAVLRLPRFPLPARNGLSSLLFLLRDMLEVRPRARARRVCALQSTWLCARRRREATPPSSQQLWVPQPAPGRR